MGPTTAAGEDDDPYIWLEQIDGREAVDWIERRNAETRQTFCDGAFEADRALLFDLLNADDRIPGITRRGAYVYNFWQDATHPKGLWRRTTLADYRNATPNWDVLLDIDALAAEEGEDWVWRGCSALPPHYGRGLVSLSRSGADAVATREFDLDAKGFVTGGFVLPEAKGAVNWFDQDRILVASTHGGEDFETRSGYPRTVRLWQRGMPFADAPIVFEGERDHMFIYGWRSLDGSPARTFFSRRLDFIHTELFVEEPSGAHRRIEIPSDCYFYVHDDRLVVNLRSDWECEGRCYPAGALLVADLEASLAADRAFAVLFAPTEGVFLQDFALSRAAVAFTVLDNVRSRATLARRVEGRWVSEPVAVSDEQAVLGLQPLDTDFSDHFGSAEDAEAAFLLFAQSAVSPPSLSLLRPGKAPELLKQSPVRFDATGLAITQHHALAADGTRIPYFQIGSADMVLDGSNPTLLTGYGGFQISSLPNYALSVGRLWLARGGVHVIANIRGGGEFGPDWHKAGMRAGKKAAHDDFAAVAKDLIMRGVTRPSRLACMGGSNGGLLVGNMYTRHPDLFGAIVCAVPLLDMRRYSKLTAGPSWIAEYGDPDKPEDWAFLRELSPYHCVRADGRYPAVLLTTSGRDDRVHPGHARKMAAKLVALGHVAHFHEPREGGHGGATDNRQLAFNLALTYAFLRRTIAPEMAATA